MVINAAKLNLAQARARMSNKELQQKSGVSDVTLSKIRKGSHPARLQTIGCIAAALDVDVTEITVEG